MSEDFVRVSVGFFAIVDPIGNILVFQAIAGLSPTRERAAIAFLAVGVSLVLITVFAAGGEAVLDFLGIGTESFQIAAGVLLVLPAMRLVERGVIFDSDEQVPASGLDAAVVPLALPMLSGPGALALATTSAAEFGQGLTIAAAGLVLTFTLAVFLASAALTALLHPTVLRAAARVVGVVLMALAIDFIVTGWQALAA